MFTSYIKNLNDMVFSTSESPEEQQSTGVLGRIGSWLSPWKGNGPKSPTGNASPTSDQAPKSEGEEESEWPVRLRAKNQEWEEEKDQSSNPNPLFLSRDISPYEERDAAQSAHRGGFIVSSTETAEGGSKKEEFVEYRQERKGQREERSNRSSESGNPEKNVSHLTHLSSSSKQGVVRDSDRAHTQPQAHVGRKLHVYLEETEVTHSGKETCAGQEIVRTEVTKKDLTILRKGPSSSSFDLNLSSKSEEIKRTNVSPAKGADSYYSALVGVSLKSPKDSQSEAESEEQTEANSMGQGILTSDNSLTTPQGKGAETHMGESSVNSSSQPNPTSQASPEGTESETSCPDAVKQLDNFQDSNSVIAASLACVVDRGSDMEDDDSLYRVERKTETPESKRRSLKVSRSEVKLFTKNVPLEKSPAGGTEEFKTAVKKTKDGEKDKPNTETDGRQHQLKKIDEEPKPAAGRIADKINLFEHPAARGNKQTFQSQRSADVSPVRKPTEKMKEEFVSLEKRSKSAERYAMAMSGTAPDVEEKPMTIKERARNFTEASKSDDRPAVSQKPAMTGMSERSSSSVAAAASTKLDNQGKLDTKERIQKQKSEITLKPDGQDTIAVGVKMSIPKEQPTDSRISNTVDSKTAEKGMKSNNLETDPTKETSDSAELTNSISPQSKSPTRMGSRPKRKKGREPDSPISPNGENKPDCSTSKAELTGNKQHQTNEAVSVTNSEKGPSKGSQATCVPSELQKESPKSPGTETEPQPHSVSVEKTENLPDDSCAHGANDSEFSSSESITKATTAAEKLTVKAGDGTPALIAAQTLSEKKASVKEHTPISQFKSEGSKGAGRVDGESNSNAISVPAEVKVSGDLIKPARRQREDSKSTESTSDITSVKGAKKIAHGPSDREASSSIVNVAGNTAEKTLPSQSNEVSLVANGDYSQQLNTVGKELVNNKPSPQANKPTPDTTQRSPMKKLHLPRGLNRDDASAPQDAPSSWLDVDFPKRKLKVPVPKLSYSGSESNLLDTSGDLDDDDFIEKIKNLCSPFSLPPRKHNVLRTPQPPFAMPAIREDRHEKTFDPDEFKFGLRKKDQFTVDTTPSFLSRLQNKDTTSGMKPARASLADRSMLLRKRNGGQTQVDGTSSGDVSPSEAPQLSPPPLSQPSSTAPLRDTLALSNREEAQAVEAVVGDSGPPFPSFNDIKLPDYLEKYLPQEPAKQGMEQVKPEVIGTMPTPAPGDEADWAVKLPHAVPPFSPGIPPITPPTLPTIPAELKQPPAQPRIRTVKGFHKRPGKMVLFEKAQFSGQAHEIFGDVADATSLRLSPLVSVMVVRGCWVLYEKPDFQGRCIALEEGGIELTNMWAEPGLETGQRTFLQCKWAPFDWLFGITACHILICLLKQRAMADTASIQVHSGVWLLFSDPGFQGMIAVLEPGAYPVPETWGFPSPFVGSLRPLKMGGFKVENPNEVKAVVFEKPGLEGSCLEIDSDVFSFCESQGDIAADGENFDSTQLKSMGSLKIIGGFWVGYSEPGFEGQQFILEEGEYLDCSDWGGSEQLLSLRPILGDFMSPHLKMFSDRDFGNLGVNIDLSVPVINMEDTGYGVKTQSVDVISGVWVLFEELGFCGESFVVEKGLYGCPEDWGALKPRVASAMPVRVDDFENAAKFKMQLFSDPGFEGSVLPLEDSAASLQDGVSVSSCKVLAGSWLAFEGQDFTGRMYVLEVGGYPDLRAMGCVSASSSILSLQTVGFEFSLPSITLFERSGLWGKRVVLTEGSVNLQLAGGSSRVQSVLVEGGMWILYEGINYRGPQILLKPGEVPDLRKFSSWQKIGSLRPLTQKRVHFRLRNRYSGLMLSVTGDLEEVKLLRIQETDETDGFDQIWFYQDGHLHCKLLEECCVGPTGSVTMVGSRVGLSPHPENHVHLWSITPEGFIRYTPTSDLVLEVKGGQHYDKKQLILKTLDPSKPQQRWDVEVI
ncbi:Beta/gamma crystallin domain containing protein 1 [Dissostichus eleginoides]|uniref:Beta/gamma crystallin domain containing protein 1 n=1 Tax=Dissostichus eleginoides TaxID=100907 RepID=A0AAD9F4X9_DISEL|nr:Beta/gamma crystallin domain containing protein 1 [Dissostichus eleginoides]